MRNTNASDGEACPLRIRPTRCGKGFRSAPSAGPRPQRDVRSTPCAWARPQRLVMPGRVPGIHAYPVATTQRSPVDGRDKPGHDGGCDDHSFDDSDCDDGWCRRGGYGWRYRCRPSRRGNGFRSAPSAAPRPDCSVMPGLVPGIHACPFATTRRSPVDGRDKPGHDGVEITAVAMTAAAMTAGVGAAVMDGDTDFVPPDAAKDFARPRSQAPVRSAPSYPGLSRASTPARSPPPRGAPWMAGTSPAMTALR